MPIRQAGLRGSKATPFDFTVINGGEGPEFESELRSRRGGADPNRRADRHKIDSAMLAISKGNLSDDQIEALIIRNPRSANLFRTAIPQGRRIARNFSIPAQESQPAIAPVTAQEAIPFADPNAGAFADEAVPGFEAQPEGLFAQAEKQVIQSQPAVAASPAVPATPAGFNREGAAIQAESEGNFALASRIRNSILRQGSPAKPRFEKVVDDKGDELMIGIGTNPENLGKIISRTPLGTNKFNLDAQKISSNIARSKLSLAMAPLKQVDGFIRRFDQTGKLPGVGFQKNLDIAPWFLTAEGKAFKRARDRLSEIDLRLLSGAATPEFELRRSAAMAAMSAASNANDFVKAYKELVLPLWRDIAANSLGGFDPRAVDRWEATTPRAKDIRLLAEGKPLTPIKRKLPKGTKPKSFGNMSEEELLNAF